MTYCLENAVCALRNNNPWLLDKVDFEPLEGLADGANRVFRTAHRPVDSVSGLIVYTQSGGTVAATAYSVVSYDGGVVRFNKGVTEQYYADYYVADQFYGATKLKEICREGFRNLMSRWPQAWYLVDSGGSTWISSDATTPTDPTVGGVTFGTSNESLHTFHLCCEYELVASRLRQAASLDVDYREGMSGGVAVNTSHRAKALQAYLDKLDKQLEDALTTLEETVSGEGYGSFVSGAKSDRYEDTYEWWDDSDQAASA